MVPRCTIKILILKHLIIYIKKTKRNESAKYEKFTKMAIKILCFSTLTSKVFSIITSQTPYFWTTLPSSRSSNLQRHATFSIPAQLNTDLPQQLNKLHHSQQTPSLLIN